MTAADDLLDDIFDGKRPALYREFAGWVLGSRRFAAFADIHRGKIRAKLRRVRDEGGMEDVRAELATAALLLRDERFALAYEQYAASKRRGPDFTATFKTHTPFNIEVRRIRGNELDDGDAEARTYKLMAVLCDKAGQMPPGIVNLLWLVAAREITPDELARAATVLLQLAERKVEDFFVRRGFANAADFLKHYTRLSGVVVSQAGRVSLWANPLARHKAPPEIVAALRRLESG